MGTKNKLNLFGFKLTRKEIQESLNPKKLVIISLGALAVNFLILAPFHLPWEGWNVVISAIGGSLLGEWLD